MHKIKTVFFVLFFVCLLGTREADARNKIIVSLSTWLVDGQAAPYNSIRPGDTVYFEAGTRSNTRIQNFTGSQTAAIVFVNYGGVVTINTDGAYGIDVKNCRYIRLTGTGSTHNFYGFMIIRVEKGAGLSFGGLTSDFECDHIYVANVPIAGVYAKTDPDCSLTSTRDHFTQYNTVFHDNYFSNTGNEGMYLGSSFYSGETFTCNGKEVTLYPSILSGVRVYNNIVRYSGWDGIQVGSAPTDCRIMNNLVMFDSQAGEDYQMSGILIGGGSNCDCYNNYVYKGKGDGIESLGLGGYRIYNNVIVDAGHNYFPGDPSKMKHGIYVNDNSTEYGKSFRILFNDIINPKTNGIRFSSFKSRGNIIASNVIINPGAGSSGYVIITSPSEQVLLRNNYQSMNLKSAGFADTTFRLLSTSPLIDAGYNDSQGINYDFYYHQRPFGKGVDIGMSEYNPKYPPQEPVKNISEGDDSLMSLGKKSKLRIEQMPFPAPVGPRLILVYSNDSTFDVLLDTYNLQGDQLSHHVQEKVSPGIHSLDLDVKSYPDGICLFTLRGGNESISGKFIKAK